MSILNCILHSVVSYISSENQLQFSKWWSMYWYSSGSCTNPELSYCTQAMNSRAKSWWSLEWSCFFAHTVDSQNWDYIFDGVVIWFAVCQKTTKVLDLCCLFSVFQWDVSLSYSHFICAVINMIHSIYIVKQVLHSDNVEHFHEEYCEPHCFSFAIISQVQFQAHLLPSLNAVSQSCLLPCHSLSPLWSSLCLSPLTLHLPFVTFPQSLLLHHSLILHYLRQLSPLNYCIYGHSIWIEAFCQNREYLWDDHQYFGDVANK